MNATRQQTEQASTHHCNFLCSTLDSKETAETHVKLMEEEHAEKIKEMEQRLAANEIEAKEHDNEMQTYERDFANAAEEDQDHIDNLKEPQDAAEIQVRTTKKALRDLGETRAELKDQIRGLEQRLKEETAEKDAEIAELRKQSRTEIENIELHMQSQNIAWASLSWNMVRNIQRQYTLTLKDLQPLTTIFDISFEAFATEDRNRKTPIKTLLNIIDAYTPSPFSARNDKRVTQVTQLIGMLITYSREDPSRSSNPLEDLISIQSCIFDCEDGYIDVHVPLILYYLKRSVKADLESNRLLRVVVSMSLLTHLCLVAPKTLEFDKDMVLQWKDIMTNNDDVLLKQAAARVLQAAATRDSGLMGRFEQNSKDLVATLPSLDTAFLPWLFTSWSETASQELRKAWEIVKCTDEILGRDLIVMRQREPKEAYPIELVFAYFQSERRITLVQGKLQHGGFKLGRKEYSWFVKWDPNEPQILIEGEMLAYMREHYADAMEKAKAKMFKDLLEGVRGGDEEDEA